MSLDRVQAACKRLFTKCMPPNRRQEDRNLFSPIGLESPGNDFQDPLIEQQQQAPALQSSLSVHRCGRRSLLTFLPRTTSQPTPRCDPQLPACLPAIRSSVTKVKPKPQQPQRKPASKAGSNGSSPRATDQYAQ